jgi:hypothetical protein
MWTQDQRSAEATEEEPSVAGAFRHVYQFILRAMQGDADAASALFQRYLAGELPEELLALSRSCVQQDQTPNHATPRKQSRRWSKKVRSPRSDTRAVASGHYPASKKPRPSQAPPASRAGGERGVERGS